MILLYPVFISENEPFRYEAELRETMFAFLKTALLVNAIEKIIVVSNDKKLIEHCLGYPGIDVSYLSKFSSYEKLFLPDGALDSLSFIPEELIDHTCLIVNYKNPLINNEILSKAADAFITSGDDIMISVNYSIDHPCQLKTFYRIKDLNAIYFVDKAYKFSTFLDSYNKMSEDKYETAVSKPFFFDWPSHGIFGESNLYYRRVNGFGANYMPLDSKDLNVDYPMFMYESSNQARILFKITNDELNSLVGVSLTGRNTYQPITKNIDEKKLKINYCGNTSNGKSIVCYSYFCKEGMLDEEYTTCCKKGSFELMIPENQGENICGLIYTYLDIVVDDIYDFHLPFPSDTDLWYFDNSKKILVNAINKKEITGRHDFPDVFEPDSSLCLMKSSRISKVRNLIENGNYGRLVMDPNRSVIVKSELDYLRYLSEMKVLSSDECV